MNCEGTRVLEEEVKNLKEEVAHLQELLKIQKSTPNPLQSPAEDLAPIKSTNHLDNASISRYSRQLILPEIGVKGQLLLMQTSVLVVGCGGLGCPAAIYLAAAGIGQLGLVDHDLVEISNLHRQILHTESRVNLPKASSAAQSCNQLNSTVRCVPYHMALDSSSALEIIRLYDIVLDASDNVATRYLLNDACILSGKPLISGSALRFEGQLTVYNYQGGPCYRCLYPKPPPPETVSNCSDGGVIGLVPGIIGSLQAMEVIKIAAKIGTTYAQRLLLFDALDGSFRTIKLRPKQAKCVVCGTDPEITALIDYEQFCGAKATDKDKSLSVLTSESRISVQEYKEICDKNNPHLLLDVRQPVELEICCLPNSTNVTLDDLRKESCLENLKTKIKDAHNPPVYVVCRRGNDSQLAVQILNEKFKDCGMEIKDIRGGLTAWAHQINKDFPTY